MMKTITLGSKFGDATVYLERGGDEGGLIVCYMVPESDGTWTSYRAWYLDPQDARAAYEAAGKDDTSSKLTLKREGAETLERAIA